MLRLLDQRPDGRRLFAVESFEDLDLEAFLPMLDRAWQLDYAGEPRLDFNATVLRRMMRDPWWVAVLAVGAGGEPIGFELALERTLYAGGRTFSAWYASIFSVAAEHRREGLGRWVLEGINRLVFDERGADLIVSTFHEGHSGSPVVQSTFDRIDDWGVARFHRSPIWSRRLDGAPLPPLEPAPAWTRLAKGDDLKALDRPLRESFGASFALTESLAAHYLDAADQASGIFCEQGGAGPRLCGYNILPMAKDDRRLRPIGQLQFLFAPGASDPSSETWSIAWRSISRNRAASP